MATGLCLQRASTKYLSYLRNYLRPLHSLSNFNDKSWLGNSRGFASEPNYSINEAGASALGVDNRVPATVVTGFLGSGKVSLLIYFTFSISNLFSKSYSFSCLLLANQKKTYS